MNNKRKYESSSSEIIRQNKLIKPNSTDDLSSDNSDDLSPDSSDDLSSDNSDDLSVVIGRCNDVLEDLSTLNGEFIFRTNDITALIISLPIFEEFKMDIQNQAISIEDIWDYDLKIADTIEPTKLVWIRGRTGQKFTIHPRVKRAFSFLQPHYLRYLDKPFHNPDVSTQVNLVLDYHRKQKRQGGVEIFNIFDLIAIKMAINDNRLEYEYSEIHNLIDQMLTEVVAVDGRLNLNEYLGDRFELREDLEFIHYLIYHFQKTIGCINWLGGSTVFNINLATIDNVTTFLEKCYTVRRVPYLHVSGSDSTGKSANILFDILTKTKKRINFTFHLTEWPYSKGGPLSEITESLTDCWLIFAAPASLRFAEEFTNWIKHIFGPRAREFITLEFLALETINSDIFIDLYVKDLTFFSCTLDCNLIQNLKKCKYGLLSIVVCKIANYNKQTFFDLTAPQIGCEQNIFKLLDELDNVECITLQLQENTIATLNAYVESVMAERNLTEYQLKNQIMIGSDSFSKFNRYYNRIQSTINDLRSDSSDDLSSDFSDDLSSDNSDDLSIVNGHCNEVLKDLITLNGEFQFRTTDTAALFIPLSVLEEFKMNQAISIEDIWDYDLKIADTIEPTKLVWIRGRTGQKFTIYPTVRRAFSFLQPHYLRYLDKPFHNPDVSTQVNLVLDYHRKQKRQRGAEIFNIFDLIAIKMAIDDNRLQFENCEFHNLIDQILTEVVAKDGTFNLNDYLGDRFEIREDLEFIHYLIYHFQETIGYITWRYNKSRFNVNVATVDDVTIFLEKCYTVCRNLLIYVRESDSTGKSANILFDILTKTKKQLKFLFYLNEWPYSRDGPLNEITESLTNCWLAIATPDIFRFPEEFTNWIKHIFGPRAREFITLMFLYLESINPDIFIDLYVKDLVFYVCTLDYKVIKCLKKCKYGLLSIVECKITNYKKQTFFDLTAPQIGCEQNIFKLLDELDNVENISLELEENTIATLHAYVESVMAERKLTEYQLKNKIMIGSDTFSKFNRNGISAKVEAIQPSIKSGDLNSNLSTLVARAIEAVQSRSDYLLPNNSAVPSVNILNDSIKLNNELEFRSDNVAALFVPLTTLKEFQMDIADYGVSIENSWDYNLSTKYTIEPAKLVWIRGRKWHKYTMHPTVKRAFSFLQPHYLRYLDKPFHNPDVSTQVNLVLDYQRKQNRERGAEIFNIFDLIAIKMAIDDIRLQLENCEFHNLIEQMLAEVVAKDGRFNLNKYLEDRIEFREDFELIHYLIYHFQKTIECINLREDSAKLKINLATIDNVTTFLEKCYTVRRIPYLHILKSDSTGKSANILFDILTKTKKKINFIFHLSEWHYSTDGSLTEITEPLTDCWLVIATPASLNFAEEFTNWIKHIFGPRAREFITLAFYCLETINPGNFIDLYVNDLVFYRCTLDYKVIKILKKCNYGLLYITECKITDYNKQRFFDLTAPQIGCEPNIFKFFDALDNVEEITLTLEHHTIATLNAYVASVMTERKLTEFQLNNKIKIGSDTFSKFKCIGTTIIIDSDSDKSDEIYDLEGPCVKVITNLIQLYREFEFQTNYEAALFIPLPILELILVDHKISIVDIWDYELIIGHTLEPIKLVWVRGRTGQKFTIHPTVRRAFSFLQPHYLRYLDKPFHNPDVSTQANLILDYHRQQKRQRGVEIFNIIDLIGFKMGIDDNRLQYENCEFHKLIDQMLTEVVAKDEKFDLNKYLEDRIEFRKDVEFLHYLIYHFQETIGYITWFSNKPIYNINLATIDDVPIFLEKVYKVGDDFTFYVSEPDSSGKSANILFDILTKTKKQIDFEFELSEWHYCNDGHINEITVPLSACWLVFVKRTSFRFVKEFTNWIKFMFGSRAREFIALKFHNLEGFDEIERLTRFPDIFIDFYIRQLSFSAFLLDYRLTEILKKCKYAYITIDKCKIVDYSMQRFDLITPNQIGCEQNIFKFFDQLDNVGEIILELEDHTIGTLFTYVASVMTERKLTEFQLKNKIEIGPVEFSKFQRNGMGMEVEEIVPYSSSGDRIDIYEEVNQLPLIDREEFDFYQ